MNKLGISWVCMLFSLLAIGCQRDLSADDFSAGGTVNVFATLEDISRVNARAGEEVIPVKNSENYSLSYSAEGVIHTDICKFDANGEGRAYPKLVPLQWKDLTNKWDKNNFILDNVENRINELETVVEEGKEVVVSFGPRWTDEEKARYRAGREPEVVGTGNDILWGAVLPEYDKNTECYKDIHFKLSHRMSRVNLVIKGFPENCSIDNAKVELQGVVTASTGFDRMTGDVLIDGVEPEESFLFYEGTLLQAEEEESGAYMTPNIIFPPQTFEETKRPILQITLQANDGTPKVYKGRLPGNMIYEDDNTSSAHSMAFRPGNHLELRVRLLHKEDDPIIEFLPVLVKEWVEVGEYIVNSTVGQRAVTSQEELDHLVHLYNSQSPEYKKDNIVYELLKYGTCTSCYDVITGGNFLYWTFNVAAGLKLQMPGESFDKELYSGQYPFDINFIDGATIDGKASAAEVVDVGIHNIEELYECIDAYNNGDWTTFLKYGTYKELKDLKIDLLADIEEAPKKGFEIGSVEFRFDNHNHTIAGRSDFEFMKGKGIRSLEQLEEVINLYNRISLQKAYDCDAMATLKEYYLDSNTFSLQLKTSFSQAPEKKLNPAVIDGLKLLYGVDLSIVFNDHTIVGIDQPSDLLGPKGIYTTENLEDFIFCYNNQSWNFISWFAEIDANNNVVVELYDNVDAPSQKINELAEVPVEIVWNGHTIGGSSNINDFKQ